MNKLAMLGCAALFAANAFCDVTITGVSSRQRWPWNNLVDVDFTINGNAGDPYSIDISATCNSGATTLTAKTFASEPVAAAGAQSRVVWDLGADYPDLKADDFIVTVTATPLKDSTPVYMVVDLSKGAGATSYPVRYTTTAPTTVAGELNPCKTTELWLRRIKAGTVKMGGGSACDVSAGYKTHTVTLTDDFYIGIFPITYAQYQNIGQTVATSRSLMHFTNETCSATRPLDSVTFPCLRDSAYLCPQDPSIHDSRSILGRLRARTGLDFDLPTEWQWEYAIRAGKFVGGNGDRYSGATYRMRKTPSSTYEYYSQERMWNTQYGTTYVDAGRPNDWGIYLVYGNVWEWCINSSMTITQNESYTDPLGNAADGSTRSRITKGCSQTWGYLGNYSGAYVSSGTRIGMDTANVDETVSWNSSTAYYQGLGARIILQIRK